MTYSLCKWTHTAMGKRLAEKARKAAPRRRLLSSRRRPRTHSGSVFTAAISSSRVLIRRCGSALAPLLDVSLEELSRSVVASANLASGSHRSSRASPLSSKKSTSNVRLTSAEGRRISKSSSMSSGVRRLICSRARRSRLWCVGSGVQIARLVLDGVSAQLRSVSRRSEGSEVLLEDLQLVLLLSDLLKEFVGLGAQGANVVHPMGFAAADEAANGREVALADGHEQLGLALLHPKVALELLQLGVATQVECPVEGGDSLSGYQIHVHSPLDQQLHDLKLPGLDCLDERRLSGNLGLAVDLCTRAKQDATALEISDFARPDQRSVAKRRLHVNDLRHGRAE
eukprot:scaffold1724_cov246-Pinguiococcus_pyrenoidosus.AAC.4